MRYLIGLDIGITSVGYTVLRTDTDGNPFKIEAMNSIIFKQAENPKTGASLAKPRRDARSSRRRTRRTKFRKYRTRQLFLYYKLLTNEQLLGFYHQKHKVVDVWRLRVKALDEPISNYELFEILYYFVGHRGFKSNRKSELKEDAALGPVLNSIKTLQTELTNYRTIGELYAKSPKYSQRKHNKGYNDGFLGTVKREWIIDEIRLILETQRKLGNKQITPSFIKAYLGDEKNSDDKHQGVFQSQRNFDKGPGAGPYAGNQIEKMVGNDTLDHHEKRAAKATFTFQYFNLLSKINGILIIPELGNVGTPLNETQRAKLIDFALTHKSVNYKQIRKVLKMQPGELFNTVNYGDVKSEEDVEKNTKFVELKAYHEIMAVLKNDSKFPQSSKNQHDLYDITGSILTLYNSDSIRQHAFLHETNLKSDTIEELLTLNYSKFGRLSLKTMKAIIPYLQKGMVYSDAVTAAGYDFRKNAVTLDYIHDNVTNPVVKRAVMKTIKVVNNIVRRYGKPDSIHIELARELSNNFEKRQEIKRRQLENQKQNEKITQRLAEYGEAVNGQNIIKVKLFDEQKGVDLYSGKPIAFEEIFRDDLYEIDHIIPYSISFDDSYTNKTLTSAKENRQKANRIPKDYLHGNPERLHTFETLVANIQNYRKRKLLLKDALTDDERKNWKARNINDTKYINRLLKNYFEQNIEFSDELDKKQRVIPLNGEVTAKIRNRWGITKVREDGDLHHAVDAVVIGCITPDFIRKVTNFSKNQELKFNKALWKPDSNLENTSEQDIKLYRKTMNNFPLPWPQFRDELIGRTSSDPAKLMADRNWDHYSDSEINQLKPIFVCRVPRKKVTGAATNATIFSNKLKNDHKIVQGVPISKLNYDPKNDRIKFGSSGIYALLEDSGNKVVYHAIKEALITHENSGSKAFPDGKLAYLQNGVSTEITKVKIPMT